MEFNILIVMGYTITIYTEEGKPKWMSIPITTMYVEISVLVKEVTGVYDRKWQTRSQ